MRETRATSPGWRSAIERSGYYPDLVADAVASTLGAEPALSYVVHHEATFDPAMEVRRHLTAMVLTPTRLIDCHTDEHPPAESGGQAYASTTCQAVALSRIHSVAVSRVVPDPQNYRRGAPPSEVVLTIGWGAVAHIDIEPATCGDESCEADHGYTGSVTADDVSVRVSAAADGEDAVRDLLRFAQALSEATTEHTT
ncbi:MAG: phosphodiesterase [Streptosporangiales bacterium]|nr:phosphodiesterase [Streptosporangiales bacterium]